MSNLPVLIAIAIGFLVINRITGFKFRLVVLAVLVAFSYYLYQSGIHEMIIAPGAPESKLIASILK